MEEHITIICICRGRRNRRITKSTSSAEALPGDRCDAADFHRDYGWGVVDRPARRLNAVVALAIACIKMTLVVLFFMHVKYSSQLTKLTVAAGFFTFIVLITMTMTDYISRAWGRW